MNKEQLRFEKSIALDAWKMRVGCKRCKRYGPASRLLFHHPDYEAFGFRIGESLHKSWDALVDEITICEVVCYGCHNRGHHAN